MKSVLVLEDFRKDQYSVRPIMQALLEAAGARQPRVVVATEPLLTGVQQVLDWNRLRQVVDRYRGMAQIFLLVVDRDGVPGRDVALKNLEGIASKEFERSGVFFGVAAREEVEVWLLAPAVLPSRWTWQAVRSEKHPKERYFARFVAAEGLEDFPYEGREYLGTIAGNRYRTVRAKCPELRELEQRVRTFIRKQQ